MYDSSCISAEAVVTEMDRIPYGSREVVTVTPDDTIATAVAKMAEHQIGSLVVDDQRGKLLGMITERDIIYKVTNGNHNPRDTLVKDIMTRDVACCRANDPLLNVQEIMAQSPVRYIPITADGVAVGMLSIRDVLVHRCATAREVRDLVIYSLAKLAESKDPETGQHLDRVQRYARLLSEELAKNEKYSKQLDKGFVERIYATCPLHDIGKVSIPDHILLKPGRLNDREFEIIKEHSAIGAETLGAALKQHPEAGFLRMATDIAAHHHERVDGTGYPDGLVGENIPLCARIFACADVYDALVSKRVYKKAFAHDIAKDIILDGAGTQFDTDVTQAFVQCESGFLDIKQFYDDKQTADA